MEEVNKEQEKKDVNTLANLLMVRFSSEMELMNFFNAIPDDDKERIHDKAVEILQARQIHLVSPPSGKAV